MTDFMASIISASITWHPVLDHHVIRTLGMMKTELCVFVPPTSARAVISFTLRPLCSPVPVALRGRLKPTAGLHAVWRWISAHAGNRSPLTDHKVSLLITTQTQLTLLSLQCQTQFNLLSLQCQIQLTLLSLQCQTQLTLLSLQCQTKLNLLSLQCQTKLTLLSL